MIIFQIEFYFDVISRKFNSTSKREGGSELFFQSTIAAIRKRKL